MKLRINIIVEWKSTISMVIVSKNTIGNSSRSYKESTRKLKRPMKKTEEKK
jgi:hypothetical protein